MVFSNCSILDTAVTNVMRGNYMALVGRRVKEGATVFCSTDFLDTLQRPSLMTPRSNFSNALFKDIIKNIQKTLKLY
ncbi:hypothetical protein BpHYR1_039262 [Brachionus plicatilis]|uniref:Uncharacterized protein n=1 Tax=Brachionus plicatilis TaxID=10195 RepID=A0A3M7SPI9_BRAPC|nr:hypothetical protein BpHYR1_039262 [Brachionus plicatilis]